MSKHGLKLGRLAHAELGLEAKRSAVSIWRFLHAWPLPDGFAKCFFKVTWFLL